MNQLHNVSSGSGGSVSKDRAEGNAAVESSFFYRFTALKDKMVPVLVETYTQTGNESYQHVKKMGATRQPEGGHSDATGNQEVRERQAVEIFIFHECLDNRLSWNSHRDYPALWEVTAPMVFSAQPIRYFDLTTSSRWK